MFSALPARLRRPCLFYALFLLLPLLSLLWASPLLASELRVVASIKPLQLIAQAVAGDELSVELLIEPTQSHHDYHLRPSDRARLAAADLVIWVGPALESYLNRTISSLPAPRVLTLAPELTPGAHDHDEHRHAAGHDAHIWLDPQRAVAMAQQIAAELSRLVPAAQARWHGNAAQFAASMAELDQRIATAVRSLAQPRPYLVMHDAYGHFEAHYQLLRGATYSATPEQQPGVRHLGRLARTIDEGVIGCVFTEPQFRAVALERMVAGQPSIRVVELDLMAGASTTGPAGFVHFFEQFAQTFLSCLQP